MTVKVVKVKANTNNTDFTYHLSVCDNMLVRTCNVRIRRGTAREYPRKRRFSPGPVGAVS